MVKAPVILMPLEALVVRVPVTYNVPVASKVLETFKVPDTVNPPAVWNTLVAFLAPVPEIVIVVLPDLFIVPMVRMPVPLNEPVDEWFMVVMLKALLAVRLPPFMVRVVTPPLMAWLSVRVPAVVVIAGAVIVPPPWVVTVPAPVFVIELTDNELLTFNVSAPVVFDNAKAAPVPDTEPFRVTVAAAPWLNVNVPPVPVRDMLPTSKSP